ncbi:hypothetical protein [Sphingomonas sp.]|uniref:hypothetical protein n=1 Tax=Sphingomonas sp. TaxID=28214 RepID=UPI0028ACFAF3|nr:hypothetical protein [Sphingomonas sp.]
MSNSNFQGDCGEAKSGYHSATCPGGMEVGGSATVNGGPTQNCVIANDGGTVFAIELIETAGIYDYQVRVDAQGPRGIFSGSMYLAFEDLTGDVYYLSITASKREWHEVSYNSSNPAIQRIFWSDVSFDVEGSKADGEKPSYQVVSPAHADADA